jgi:hypothetical protein
VALHDGAHWWLRLGDQQEVVGRLRVVHAPRLLQTLCWPLTAGSQAAVQLALHVGGWLGVQVGLLAPWVLWLALQLVWTLHWLGSVLQKLRPLRMLQHLLLLGR